MKSKDTTLVEKELEEFKELTKALLCFADLASRAPHHIVQPGLGIIKKHVHLIKKYNLL